ncbi:uncharacterized protein [Musca autumnalis]|uniref:uncharacterized protein n=1 Tax=Musca autumnalis TaxID=221902 RepID=UPI003CEEC824
MSNKASRRFVKITSTEQFDLLKHEMLLKPEAAMGYCHGVDRAKVDAQWKEIVEKLNALGPPHRTVAEWKKVWSDVRLRTKKRISERIRKGRKILKGESDSEEDFVLDSIPSSQSLYGGASQSWSSNEHHFNDQQNTTDLQQYYTYQPDLNRNEEQHHPAQQQQFEMITNSHQAAAKKTSTSTKKTSTKQFNLLNLEMSRHPSAARGYVAGVDRQQADREWQEIVDKLNAIGPPYRSMSEWKKVWSDARSRLRKRMCDQLMKKHYLRKRDSEIDDDFVMETTLNNSMYSMSSYEDYVEGDEPDDDEVKTYAASLVNVCHEEVNEDDIPANSCLSPKQNTVENDDDDGDKTYAASLVNVCHEEVNEDDISAHPYLPSKPSTIENEIPLEASENETKDYKKLLHSALNIPSQEQQQEESQNKVSSLEHALYNLQQQMQQNNALLQHLTGISVTLANLLERHVTATEKMSQAMERQSKTNSFNTFMQRRRENRAKGRSKKFYEFF